MKQSVTQTGYINLHSYNRGNLAIWFNRMGHWIVGYENDAKAGYSSGILYSDPGKSILERKCPQVRKII